jgi:hypothetical protein
MSDYDLRLKDGLTAEDEAFLKDLEDRRGLFSQMGDTFTGPMAGWTVFAWALSLVFFAFAVFCFYKLAGVSEMREGFLWLGGALAAWVSVGLIKIWFWLRMNHLATLREMKKIELRLARSES